MQNKKSNTVHLKADKRKTSLVRLNKFMANAGICNRREADDLILQGLVKVNNSTVTTLGIKVSTNDIVELDGQRIYPGEKKYVLLNKPKDFTCHATGNDQKSALDLVKNAFDTSMVALQALQPSDKGLLVITNDLQLEKNLNANKGKINSLFKVEIDQPLKPEHFKLISKGIILEGEPVKPNKIAFVDDNKKVLGIDINISDLAHIRQLLGNLGYNIQELDRVIYNGLTKKNIARGQWRFLTDREIIQLRKNTK